MSGPLLEAALSYIERGQAVFPVAGKAPRTPNGFKDATTNPAQAEAWWTQWPDAGIGHPTGGGTIVVDVDPRSDGHQSMAELSRRLGPMPVTWKTLTGGGGEHYWLSAPLDLVLPKQLATRR